MWLPAQQLFHHPGQLWGNHRHHHRHVMNGTGLLTGLVLQAENHDLLAGQIAKVSAIVLKSLRRVLHVHGRYIHQDLQAGVLTHFWISGPPSSWKRQQNHRAFQKARMMKGLLRKCHRCNMSFSAKLSCHLKDHLRSFQARPRGQLEPHYWISAKRRQTTIGSQRREDRQSVVDGPAFLAWHDGVYSQDRAVSEGRRTCGENNTFWGT